MELIFKPQDQTRQALLTDLTTGTLFRGTIEGALFLARF